MAGGFDLSVIIETFYIKNIGYDVNRPNKTKGPLLTTWVEKYNGEPNCINNHYSCYVFLFLEMSIDMYCLNTFRLQSSGSNAQSCQNKGCWWKFIQIRADFCFSSVSLHLSTIRKNWTYHCFCELGWVKQGVNDLLSTNH